MKKISVVFSISLMLWSYVKNKELIPVTQTIFHAVVSGVQESFGIFNNGVHSTSGMVKIVADKADVKENTSLSRILNRCQS